MQKSIILYSVRVCLPLTPPLPPLRFPPSLSLLPLQTLTVTIQGRDQRRDSVSDDTKSDKVEVVSFPCPQLGRLQTWHHVIVTVSKTLRQKAKVSLYVDGISLGVQKVLYMYFIMGIYTSTYVYLYRCAYEGSQRPKLFASSSCIFSCVTAQ